MRILKFIASTVIAGAVLAADFAYAQTCFTMQAEMMHLQARGGGARSGGGARYERAYREQADVLARTEARARNAGCFGGGLFIFRRQDASCEVLIPRIRDMQDNLARLDAMRRRGGNNDSNRLAELRGMMAARGCDIPGGGFASGEDPNFVFEQPPQQQEYYNSGTFRTLCVRTCDGYYFPISFSTTSEQFGSDEQSCQAMCPGAEARLYYYSNPGGGPENMTAISGEPYSSLPTAFQYRTAINSSCTCQPPGGYATSTASLQPGAVSVPLPEDTIAPLPRSRPAAGEDPETLANRAGFYVPRAPREVEPPPPGPMATGPDGRSVRVVGPVYWGDTEQDNLVIVPVPN